MIDIQWEEPPQHLLEGQRVSKYREFADALRQHPGRWALLPTEGNRTVKGAKATRVNIKRGRVGGMAEGEFDALVDATDEDNPKIYVRFVGKEQATPEKAEAVPKQKAKDSAKDEAEPSVGEVRAWARAKGIDVPDRGMLSRDLFEKYAEAVEKGEVTGLHLRAVSADV